MATRPIRPPAHKHPPLFWHTSQPPHPTGDTTPYGRAWRRGDALPPRSTRGDRLMTRALFLLAWLLLATALLLAWLAVVG